MTVDKDEMEARAEARFKEFSGRVVDYPHPASIDAIAQALHDGSAHQGDEPVEDDEPEETEPA